MNLPGLPPLPKSLIGIDDTQMQASTNDQQNTPQTTTLDTQLATLRREMVSIILLSN